MSNLISQSCRVTGASVAGKNYVVKKVPLPEKKEEEMPEKSKEEDKAEDKENGDKEEGEKEEEEVKENQTNLLPYQIEILEKAFKAFAQEEDFISPDMVGKILRMMGVAFTEDSLQEMINEIDEDGSGQIEFEEFIQLAVKFVEDEEDADVEKELKEAFRMYDKEGQGFITTATLKQILHEIDDTLTDDQLDQIIIEVDSDGSGTLDFDEFMEMMNG